MRKYAQAASVILLLCLAAACAPMQAPPGLETVRPRLMADQFRTRDGWLLPVRHWGADDAQATIIALHGMGDYANAFAMPAPFWGAHGIETYAYDQRGFGNAPFPGLWPGGQALRGDLRDFLRAVKARHPHRPLFVLGASMGGAVVLSALAERPLPADGVILVAPAVWGRADMPVPYEVALWLAAHITPAKRFTGEGLKIWPSDNIPMLRAYAADLLVHKGTRADAIWGLVNLMDQAQKSPAKIKNAPPILLLYGVHDQIVPATATQHFIKAMRGKLETHKFPHGYHMLLRDLHAEQVWQTVVDWVTRQSCRGAAPH